MKQKRLQPLVIKGNRIQFGVVDMGGRASIPECVERKQSGRDYVSWGADNKYPTFLFDLYKNSSILGSIVNGTANYAMGEGIVTSDVLGAFPNNVNSDFESLSDVVNKLLVDYCVFGGFAIEIIRNGMGEISEICASDFAKWRTDGDGRMFFSEDWGGRNAEAREYEEYDRTKKQKHSVYYFTGHKSRGVYPLPIYAGAIPAVQTSIEIAKFHLNSILNNFTPSAVISFNNGQVSDDEADDTEKRITDKFCGTSNASRILTIYTDSKENAPEITRLEADNFDQKYNALRESTMQEIFVAFGATPNLFGLPTATTGFSKQEFIEGFALYQHNMLDGLQRDIERAFAVIFGVPEAVKFVKLNLYKETNNDGGTTY